MQMTPNDATAEAEKLAAQKVRKGYAPLEGQASITAESKSDKLLAPEQTRSYLPQDGYEQELTSSHRTDQVLKRYFIHR